MAEISLSFSTRVSPAVQLKTATEKQHEIMGLGPVGLDCLEEAKACLQEICTRDFWASVVR